MLVDSAPRCAPVRLRRERAGDALADAWLVALQEVGEFAGKLGWRNQTCEDINASGKDAAEWLPDLNHCWFASRVVEVRQRYGLTVDGRERDMLESILSGCTSIAMVVHQSRPAQTATPVPAPGGGQTDDALQQYDDNGNGRITCAEARSHGIAPVRRGHPAYPYMTDGDGDGGGL